MFRALPLVLCGLLLAGMSPAFADTVKTQTTTWPKVGVGKPANCSFSSTGALEDNWLEMTDLRNYTQYTSLPGQDTSGVPNPLPPPFQLTASDAKAPGFAGTCFSKSPSAPKDCTDDCKQYYTNWGVEWFAFGTLLCMGSYPTPNVTSMNNPVPPPGNVGYTMTIQCKNYNYPAGIWNMMVTDEYGAQYMLQTTQSEETPTDAEWQENMNSIVWPKGWIMNNVTFNSNQTQTPFFDKDGTCWMLIIKDSNGNSWHQYTYPIGPSILDKNDCVNFIQHRTKPPPTPKPKSPPAKRPSPKPKSPPAKKPSPKPRSPPNKGK